MSFENIIKPYLPLIIGVGAIAVGFVAYVIVFFFLKRLILRKTANPRQTESFINLLRSPVRLFFPILALKIVLPSLVLSRGSGSIVDHLVNLLLISSLTFIAIRAVNILKDYVISKYKLDQHDNLQARKIHTQINVIRRIVIVGILLVSFSSMLMTFEKVRQLGTSILASAGIIGIILGIAAQKSISTLIAGLQIAITQPIRLDDVVIVEGEWGNIEEITLTYVVVKIWDQRRLVLPITYFLEKPFQNWTRRTSELLSTVFIYVDYTFPVERVREELKNILQSTPLWDKRVCTVQVTKATERTIEVRALMSAADSSIAWDLRCLVREKLIDFLKNEFPNSIPRSRVELERDRPRQGKDEKEKKEVLDLK